jgi:hypothetical protein
MKDIYLEVSERLGEQVPEIRIIDLDCGQIDAGGQHRLPLDFPLALVRISIQRAEDVSRTEQNHHVQIVVRLAWEAWPGEVSNLTPTRWRGVALSKLDLVEKVTGALQGWGGSFFDYLSLSSIQPQDRADGLMVYRLTFKASYEWEVGE